MHEADARAWFAEYVDAFAACGRGESDDLRALLRFYGVPLILTTDGAAMGLTTDDEVIDTLRAQIEGLRSAGYHRSETLAADTATLNGTSILHTVEFSRRRSDEFEIGRLRATYLIADGEEGRRIRALVVHTR
jgi:hypothetical protein